MISKKKIFFYKLNQRIRIQKPISEKDNFGGLNVSWEDFCSIWANIQPVQVLSKRQYSHLAKSITYKITTRFYPNLLPEMRILHNNELYGIHNIIPMYEQENFLIIYASKEVG